MNQKILFTVFIASLLLIIRYVFFFLYAPKLYDGQQISFYTTILTEPSSGRGFNRIQAFYGNIFGAQRISITYSQKITLEYGQSMHIIGKVEKRLSKKNSSFFSMYFPKIESQKAQNNIILAIAYSLRQKVKSLYFESLSKEDASLLLGIVFGIKGEFSNAFMLDLQSAGVLHVIAASGMNVTMVAGFLFSLASKFLKRQYATVLCIAVILFYVVLSGLQASIVRAAIMACLVFTAQLFGRQYIALYGIFLTAFFMLFTKPELILDIGFQLSLFATLGILLIKPLFPQNKILDDISTTLSAQIATLPILLGTFGQYGLLSVLVNAFVLWTIPPLMILGGVGVIIGLVIAPLGKIIIYLSIPLLWFFEKVVSYFGSLGWNINLKNIPGVLIVGYYFLLLSMVIFLIRKRTPAT